MVVASNIVLRELMEEVLYKIFGFLPTNGSIKPVHVANGFARASIGATNNTSDLNRMLVQWVRDQRRGYNRQANPTDVIARDYADVFRPQDIIARGRKGRLDVLRRLLKDSFGSDDAVFESGERSSYTLSHQSFVTADLSDNGVGNLIFLALESNGSLNVIDTTRGWLSDGTDAWTILGQPFLQLVTEIPRTGTRQDDRIRSAILDSEGHLTSDTLRRMCGCFERLITFEQQQDDKLNGLRRFVTLACFVCYLYLTRRWNEMTPEHDFAANPPILIDLHNGRIESVANASHTSYNAAVQATEQMIREGLRASLGESIGQSPDHTTVVGFINEVQHQRNHSQQQWEDRRDRYMNRYTALRDEVGSNVFESLINATFDSGLEALNRPPMAFMREIGRRSGFLAPWANRSERKRYSISNEFLEIIVVSVLSIDEACEFSEFLKRIKDQFGIVVGTPEDYHAIRQNNLRDGQFGPAANVSEDDLRSNTIALRDRLRDIGYAKTYADGTTIVSVERSAG